MAGFMKKGRTAIWTLALMVTVLVTLLTIQVSAASVGGFTVEVSNGGVEPTCAGSVMTIANPGTYFISTAVATNDRIQVTATGSVTLYLNNVQIDATGNAYAIEATTMAAGDILTIGGTNATLISGTSAVHINAGTLAFAPNLLAYAYVGTYNAPAMAGTQDIVLISNNSNVANVYLYTHKSGTSVPYYNIEVTQEGRGLVDPDGGDDDKISVRQGNDKTFEFQPLHYAKIYNVIVDGEELGPMDSYTFEDVRETHTIHVMFCAEDDPDWVNPNGADGDEIDPLDLNGNGIPDSEEVDPLDLNGNGIPDSEEVLEATLNRDDHNAYAQGYEDGTFRPEDYISRAETITEFFESLVLEYDENTEYFETFSDVTGEEWYANTLGFMQQAAVVQGYSDNTFRGDNFITRAEFAVIASRFDDLDTEGENNFSDVDDDYWAIDYINSAAAKGWIVGYTDGTFRPDQYITRAEAVTMINRVLDRTLDEDFAAEHAEDMVEFPDVAEDHWAADQIVEATNGHDYTIQDGVEIWTGIL